MLVLRTNRELENTYRKLIQTMGARVDWNGLFIVRDDSLILEGSVRSLFFDFDTKKVRTDIEAFDYAPDGIIEVGRYPKLKNLINMILYAFGKWGTLKGLRVEQDYAQLNDVFSQVTREFQAEPLYRHENFRFYRGGIQITYEELIQLAIEAQDKPVEEPPQAESGEEAQGLWHRLVWRNQQRAFRKVPTTLEERQKERIGHNFYQVGYQCPFCAQKLHMAVYPSGKEQRIETQELGVYIARAYTCPQCGCFFTPRPYRLIAEGYIYEMPFGGDRKAYEDYLELLGKSAERTANFKYNEYEALRSRKPGQEEIRENEYFASMEEAEGQFEAYSARLDSLPDAHFDRFTSRIEDGFYPDRTVRRHEKKILEQVIRRNKKKILEEKRRAAAKNKEEAQPKDHPAGKKQSAAVSAADGRTESTDGAAPEMILPQGDAGRGAETAVPQKAQGQAVTAERPESGISVKSVPQSRAQEEKSASYERYRGRLGVLGRLSDRQRNDLKRQIENDASLDGAEKEELLRPIEEARIREKAAEFEKKVDSCEDGRTYAQIQKVEEEIQKAPLPHEVKHPLLERLGIYKKRRAQAEVAELMENLPPRMDFAGFRSLRQKLENYPDADLSPYQDDLREKRETAEKQEIANLVKRARKIGRDDYTALMLRLEEQGFAEENVTPYMEKLQEKIREMDRERLDEICDKAQQMDFDAAYDAYEQIDQGDFLPELKMDALEMLKKRLAKIKTDECELLVRKLKDDIGDKIRENPKHYFYPARKVLLKTAEPEETALIDSALAAYAGGRGPFEYPILVVDTSRGGSGREGMVLTPEHIFYSSLLKAYRVPVSAVRSIDASTGLLNRRITIEEKDGVKHKLPYAVGTGEMKAWAGILEEFVHYLQEKPASREVAYLAKNTHDKICCFRCGYVYKGSPVCPKCGYKKNQ